MAHTFLSLDVATINVRQTNVRDCLVRDYESTSTQSTASSTHCNVTSRCQCFSRYSFASVNFTCSLPSRSPSNHGDDDRWLAGLCPSKAILRSSLPRDPIHSVDYTVARCPSVRPSIRLSVRLTHAGIVSKRLNITSNVIHRLVTSSNGDRRNGHVECKVLWKITIFKTNISLYIGNDTRYDHSYYGIGIIPTLPNGTIYGNLIHDLYFTVTLNDLSKRSMTRSIARSVCDSWASCSLLQYLEIERFLKLPRPSISKTSSSAVAERARDASCLTMYI